MRETVDHPRLPEDRFASFSIFWILWTGCLILFGVSRFANATPEQVPRLAGIFAPLTIFTLAGLVGAFRSSWLRYTVSFIAAWGLAALAWWFMPNTFGLNYYEARQCVEDLQTAVAHPGEFWPAL